MSDIKICKICLCQSITFLHGYHNQTWCVNTSLFGSSLISDVHKNSPKDNCFIVELQIQNSIEIQLVFLSPKADLQTVLILFNHFLKASSLVEVLKIWSYQKKKKKKKSSGLYMIYYFITTNKML